LAPVWRGVGAAWIFGTAAVGAAVAVPVVTKNTHAYIGNWAEVNGAGGSALPVKVGDSQYGGGPAGERLGLTRQFLHSANLRFMHPEGREPLRCESKLPVDLLRILEAAAREPVSEGPDGD